MFLSANRRGVNQPMRAAYRDSHAAIMQARILKGS
jgi:hypothetical protein